MNSSPGRACVGWFAVVWVLLCGASEVVGQPETSLPPERIGVAPSLEPWVDWVLHELHDRPCAQLRPEERRCVWPGVLRLDANEAGARFEMEVWVGSERAAVPLPGNSALWPREVQLNGKPLVVAKRYNVPATILDKGFHTVTGRFVWRPVPGFVPVPTNIAQIELRVGSGLIERPRLDEQGRLWLRDAPPQKVEPAEEETADDTLRASIVRHLRDGVPVGMTNRLELIVSGRPRQVLLERVLVEGTRPVRVSSNLPVQVSPEGNVGAYVRPGTHVIEIETNLPMPAHQIKARSEPKPDLEDREVWVWQPDTLYRAVKASGLTPVDPERTNVPEDWRMSGGMTFLAEPGQALALEPIRRGEV
ncbi:MAG: hypothetical protein AAFX99_22460, partial [Myxococcota bacterium]